MTSIASGPLPAGGSLTMPGDIGGLLGREFRGTVRLARSFNRPTGLAAGQRVWLVVEQIHERGTVEVNGTAVGHVANLPDSTAGRFEITALLKQRNEIAVEVACGADSPQPGALGLVKLEIEQSVASAAVQATCGSGGAN
jgi:hypothetical protein